MTFRAPKNSPSNLLAFYQGGFSLVEIIIATTIFIIVSGLLIGTLVNNTNLLFRQNSVVQQGVGSNESLSSVRSSIKQAEGVATQYPTSGQVEYSSGPGQLVLRLTSTDSSGNPISNVSDYYVYYLSSGKLRFKTIPNAQSYRKAHDSVLALNVQSILFEYFDSTDQVVAPNLAKKVKITLTLREKAGTSIQTSVATSEAQLRND